MPKDQWANNRQRPCRTAATTQESFLEQEADRLLNQKTVAITDDLITAGKGVTGAWSSKQLRILGVSWPPATGWKNRVIGKSISEQSAKEFVALRNTKKPKERKVEGSDSPDLLGHSSVICCKGKALAVFRVVEGETRVNVTCRFCQRVIEANLPQKEAARRARKGNFYLIEPAEENLKRTKKAR